MKDFKLYINGNWVNSNSGETFTSLNPATGKALGRFQKGNVKDAKKAIDAAERAFPKWRDVPAPKRGQILLKAAELLKKDKERLARLLTLEMGKVLSEARGDVQEAIDMAELMAGEGRRLYGHTTPSDLRNKLAFTLKQPLGVVSLITPWNFPYAIPSWKTFPALICGNTVVFKPSSDVPLTATEFVKILVKAGVPKGVVNMVTGPGSTVGKELVANKKVRGVSFTGSKETGQYVVEHANLKKVGLELGGKNAIIIMDDADLKLALDGVIWSAFGTTGQRCTACSRIIVHKKISQKFQKMLLNKIKTLKLGDGLNSKTDIGPLINKAAVEKSQKYVEIGKHEGAKLCCGGSSLKGKGFFFKPTLFTDATIDMKIAQDEIFGPVLTAIEIKNLREAINTVNGVEYGLSSSIYTASMHNAFKAVEQIEAGLVYVNSGTIGSEVHLPFGGVKATGNGAREGGIESINEFSETKTVYIDYSGKLQKAQIDEVEVD
jgi:aldehyde dehydrogenase (NAD+)